MEQFDIWLDNDQELQVENNDFKLGFVDNNLIKYIVLAAPGHYKTYPNVGANIYKFLLANVSPAQIERAIRAQLEGDVFQKIKIDASAFPTININQNSITIG
jgi:hypothetical protein